MIQPNDVVLFQGDSITDCGRARDASQANAPEAIGHGYAFHAAAALLADHPTAGLRIFNRGIGGNKVIDLADRWQADCLDLEPTLLSVLIGVNDTWHGTGKGQPANSIPLDVYEQTYRQILEQARATVPTLRLVLCEPFTLRCGAVTDAWFPEIDDRRAIVRKLAEAFGAVFVAFQAAFDRACEQAEPGYWADDGVHPSMAGHKLMARTWLDAVSAGPS